MKPHSLAVVLAIAAATALAGCAMPGGEEESSLVERVAIEGRVYECDDAFDADNVCDEYELVDDARPDEDTQNVTRGSSGNLEINGAEYECDDRVNLDAEAGNRPRTDAGACEEYEHVEG